MTHSDGALQARTSVSAASSGLLTTYARHPAGQTTMPVPVTPRIDGTVDIQLDRHGVAARQLLARPFATLELHPTGCQPVLLHGAARRLPGTAADGALLFRLDATTVRIGSPPALLGVQDYAAAAPDPFAAQATGVLDHLNSAHAEALTSCLRAVGHRVGFAHATGLDTAGLTVVAVHDEGVDRVRLQFPRVVADLSQLPTSLAVVLNPRCGCRRPSSQLPDDGRTPER